MLKNDIIDFMNKRIVVEFLLHDVLPWTVLLALFILLALYLPWLLVGLVVGWLLCKFRKGLLRGIKRVKGSSGVFELDDFDEVDEVDD